MNKLLAALVPPGVVTTTLAVPALPGGVVQLAFVLLFTMTEEQTAPPTVMAVAPVRLLPVMAMVVPPKVVPVAGLMAETVGAGVT